MIPVRSSNYMVITFIRHNACNLTKEVSSDAPVTVYQNYLYESLQDLMDFT